MAGIRNRGNGSWVITLYDGYAVSVDGETQGKKYTQKRIYRTVNVDPKKTESAQRKLVEREAARLQADYDRHQITAAKKLSFAAVFEDYIHDRVIRKGLAQQTVDSYRKLFDRKLIPEFGHRAIREINAHDLNVFFRNLKKKVKNKDTGKMELVNVSGTYARKYYQQLNEFFVYAQRSGIIAINPCTLIDPPKIDTPEAQFYDKDEIPAVVNAIRNCPDPIWKAYFSLSFYCGCRPEEITGLNWTDYDGKQISISGVAYQAKGEKTKRIEQTKTKKSRRKISLTPEAIAALNAWKRTQAEYRLHFGDAWPGESAMFTNEDGDRIGMRAPSKAWKRFTAENGLRHLPLYDLRHTNCSLLISSRQLSVEEVAARMGHSQTSTTLNVYTHCFNDANERATNALMDALKSCQ